jgi:opacity protein-like surface antigen
MKQFFFQRFSISAFQLLVAGGRLTSPGETPISSGVTTTKDQQTNMKRNFQSFALAAVCTCVTMASAAAHAATGFYVRADLGGTWSADTELKEYFGPVAPGSKVKFDPGVRFGVAGGYQFCDWFDAEVQTGFMAANIRSISDADRVDAVFSNVPVLLNARLQWPSRCPLTPYIGGGAGLSVASLSIEEIDLNGTSVDGSEADAVFAYQGFAGIRYRLNDRMGLSLEYRYFATTEPSWGAKNISGDIRFGCIETHSVSVAFDFKF